jgi:hypothetical protein
MFILILAIIYYYNKSAECNGKAALRIYSIRVDQVV